MDLPRTAIIAAMLIVLVMLMSEWVEFKKARSAGELPVASASQPPPPTADVRDDVPTGQDIGDMPAVPTLAAEPAAETAAETITISSDSLRLRVDLRGGDIVGADLLRYANAIDDPTPLALLEQTPRRVYVAQSGLVGPQGIDKPSGRALFTAARDDYAMAPGQDSMTVSLRHADDSGVVVNKLFTLRAGSHAVTVTYSVDNASDSAWRAAMYAQIKRDGSPDPGADMGIFGVASFLGAAVSLPDTPFEKIDFDDIAEQRQHWDVQGGWLAMVQHYFLSAWIPSADQQHRYATAQTPDGHYIVRLTTPALSVPARGHGRVAAQFYAGPKNQNRLRELADGLELTVDYGWLFWIAQPLFWLLTWLHGWLGNWGWSIIGLTMIIKLLFFQLSAASYRSMAKMRVLQPKLLALRDQHGSDRQQQSRAMMELYKKEGVNPLGGCLPILVQMPVFIALYWVLLESVELRQAPFALWIHDLSTRDPYFVLPLLMGGSMFLQQRLNPTPPDPMQARIMQWLPVVFTLFFLFFPAGLVLYWLVNNVLSIAQQWLITRRITAQAQAR